jgi:hypothetical protein
VDAGSNPAASTTQGGIMSEQQGIHAAMIGILADIGAIDKSQKNTSQGYAFRGIDQFLNAVHPLMAKHGVYVTPVVERVDRSERASKSSVLLYSIATVRFVFRATDGSSVECVTVGEGMDSGDKATNKAMSAAYKYALMQVFAVPTEEMIDGDAESHEVTNGAPKSARKTNLEELYAFLEKEAIDVSDAIDYCRAKEMLDDTQTLDDLSDKHLTGIVRRLMDFSVAVYEYLAATTPDETE